MLEINKIYNENCVDTMNKMNENFIDLVVTSPPYDNLRNYNGYEFDWKIVIKELYKVIKIGGVCVWIVGDSTINGSETGTSFKQALYTKDCGFNLHDTMIYQKDSNPFPETNRYYPRFEYMFIFSKGKPKTVNLIQDVENKRYGEKVKSSTQRQKDGSMKKVSANKTDPNRRVKNKGIRGNVWLYSPGYMKSTLDKEAYKIPAIFPEKLCEDHIISWSNENDLIYDPFMGSGTTAKMCVLNNRNFIGSEISKEYYDIANNRIKDYIRN